MAAEGRHAATPDRRHHLELVETDTAGIGFAPCRTTVAEDIRNLQGRAQHARRGSRAADLAELERDVLQPAHDLADRLGGDAGMLGWRARLFRLLRNARGVDRSHSLGPAAAKRSSLAPAEKHHGVVERHWLRRESQGSCATRPVAAVVLGLSHGAKPSASGSPVPTSNCSGFRLCLARVSATSRTAVYGPVRTEGRSREAPPYPDLCCKGCYSAR